VFSIIQIPDMMRFRTLYKLHWEEDLDIKEVTIPITDEEMCRVPQRQLRHWQLGLLQQLCDLWRTRYGENVYFIDNGEACQFSFVKAKDVIIDGEWRETPKEIEDGRQLNT
jgi:hypothetical protein